MRISPRLVAESDDLSRFIKSPVYSAEEQLKALNSNSGSCRNFRHLRQFSETRRDETSAVRRIADMIADFHKLDDLAKGRIRAEVTVAASR